MQCFRGQEWAYSRLLIFLIGGNIAGLWLLLRLLGGDHCLLINLTLGGLASRRDLLLVLILLGALARAGVNAGLVVVALPTANAHSGAGVVEP